MFSAISAWVSRHDTMVLKFGPYSQCISLCAGVSSLRLTDDATSEVDRDTLAPLPLPTPWGSGPGATVAGAATPHIPYYPTGYAPMPYSYSSDPLGAAPVQTSTFTYGREGSVHSGSGISFYIYFNCDISLLPNFIK